MLGFCFRVIGIGAGCAVAAPAWAGVTVAVAAVGVIGMAVVALSPKDSEESLVLESA